MSAIDLTRKPQPGEVAFEWPTGFVPTYVDNTPPHQIRLVLKPREDCVHSNTHSCTGFPKAVMVECSCGELESTTANPDPDEAMAIWRAHVAEEAL